MGRLSRSLLIIGLLAASSVGAGEREQDRARRLVQEGAIVPLERLLVAVREHAVGELLEIELEEKHGRLVYEVEVVDPDGRVVELLFDAGSAEFLGRESDD
jgi:uncharacterized membrane protein YkoI